MKKAFLYIMGAPIMSFSANPAASAQAVNAAPAVQAEPAANSSPTAPADNGAIGDIVVTAQRRSERLQDVPIAISAVTSTTLGNAGVNSTLQLEAAVPSLNVATGSGGLAVLPRIRGVGAQIEGPGIENSVATYIDGVYIAAPEASQLSLANIDRVEVLKGPQGTLFGRNATGGLINVITKDPTAELSGHANLTYGDYNTLEAVGYLAGPISDHIRADIGVQFSRQGDGYGTNFYNGAQNYKVYHDINVRSKWIFEPGVGTKLTLVGDYANLKKNIFYSPYGANILPQSFRAAPFTGSIYDTDVDYAPPSTSKSGGVSLRVDQGLGDLNFMSLTAYRANSSSYPTDYDASTNNFLNINPFAQKGWQFSQELQLQSPGNAKFHWIIGAYYFDAKAQWDPFSIVGSGPLAFLGTIQNETEQKTQSYAGFAQADVKLGDHTTLTGGLRYTIEDRSYGGILTTFDAAGAQTSLTDFDGFPGSKLTSKKLTFRAAINHRFDDRLMIYASFNRGFRSGGFNLSAPGTPAFEPEGLDAYEVGFKADPIPGRLRLNVAGFYYNYTNIQVQKYVGATAIVVNGSGARIYGGEADLVATLAHNLKFTSGLSYTHDRFTAFPDAPFYVGCPVGAELPCSASAKGFPLPSVPTFTATAALDYTIPLGDGSRLLANTNIYHNSGYTSDPGATFRQPAYDYINASLTWHSAGDKFSLGAWGRNLTDKAVFVQAAPASYGGFAQALPPRTYGVTAGINF
jgi:outer membrane receptor protein involved in Fe transport